MRTDGIVVATGAGPGRRLMISPPRLPLPSRRETALSIPRHLRYAGDHEWLVVDKGNATAGITAFAAKTLGDAVHLRLPEVARGSRRGESCRRDQVADLRERPVRPRLGSGSGSRHRAGRRARRRQHALCTVGRLFRLRVENIAGALSADACAAHCAHTQGDRR